MGETFCRLARIRRLCQQWTQGLAGRVPSRLVRPALVGNQATGLLYLLCIFVVCKSVGCGGLKHLGAAAGQGCFGGSLGPLANTKKKKKKNLLHAYLYYTHLSVVVVFYTSICWHHGLSLSVY